ncbi:DUF418 domain-containing protein YeiB [Providencia sp.]|uniref:DUF418 domain-containing protein YeiB n=1 Tax=Providencia sp. TaxID=589 RepID=UPI003F9802D4
MTTTEYSIAPKGRIEQLDTVRGIAILGILLMNIFAFALPQTAYLNPFYSPTVQPSEAIVWGIFNLFFQGKVLAIFTLLFGATLALLHQRSYRWNQCRLIVLAIFGLIHGVGFWDGDILLAYSLTGFVALYMLNHGSKITLLKIAIAIYLIGLVILWVLGSGVDPSYFWQVTDAQVFFEASQKTIGGMESLLHRADCMLTMIEMLLVQYGWQLLALMTVGALLMQNGWLRGQFSQSHYRLMALILIPPALLVQILSLYIQSLFGWSFFATSIVGYIINELMIPLQSLGYIALIYGFWRSFQQSVIARLLQNIGRMALSNYLLQTLICTTIFYHLGYFGSFTRVELLVFIVPIWGVNLAFSYYWLQFFKQGPIEWSWRKLTEKLYHLSVDKTQ